MKANRLRSLFCWTCYASLLLTSSSASFAQKLTKDQEFLNNFRNPPQTARPQVRFWVPGAAVTDAGLKRDIDALAQYGFGGLEVVGFEIPEGVGKEYAWGSGAWNHLMRTAAEEAGKNGITVDFTNGPQWPVAMPAIQSADSPGALFELTYGTLQLQPGQTYNGAVPARRKIHQGGKTKLFAVLAYRLIAPHTLDASSVIDLTSAVKADANNPDQSTVSFSAPEGDGSWILFSFWEQPSAQKTEGLYVIDHFSKEGSNASNLYWEQTALPNLGNDQRFMRSIFNDSLEYAVTMEWTRGMANYFKQQHGYDITPYLPFVGMATTYPVNDIPGYTTTDPHLASKVEYDYRNTLTSLFIHNHLMPMEQMAERHGLNLRYQVSYNKPMQIEDTATAVGIPETEALGRASVDMQRYMAGAVHLTGKPIYSIETSAEFQNGYGQSLQDIVWWSKRAWAAGVNMQRLHGTSYSGKFDGSENISGHLPGISWPGYSAFGVTFSNNWTRQTSPDALHQVLTYIARTNYILQNKAKVDIAIFEDAQDIFNDHTRPLGDGHAVYPDGGVLNASGFSYEFVTPALLALPQATVTNGELDIQGPAYKALVVHNQAALTFPVIERLRILAAQGLKIVFVGNLPDHNASFADQLKGHSDGAVRASIAALLKQPNVSHCSEYAEVPATLNALNIHADAIPDKPTDILVQHRMDPRGDYYYLYNYNRISDADATEIGATKTHTKYPDIDKSANFQSKGAVYSFAAKGRPYLLNSWTGEITAIPQFDVSDGRVRLPIQLQGDQALLIAFLTDPQARAMGIVPPAQWATDSNIAFGDLRYSTNGKLLVSSTHAADYSIRLNTQKTFHPSVASVEAPIEIQDWKLAVRSMEAPSNGSVLYRDSVWKEIGPFELGRTLHPWSQIDPQLERVSGIGTYTGSFTLLKGWDQKGSAYVDLGPLDDSFTVTINGHLLPQPDTALFRMDLGQFAQSGTNQIVIQTATTLYNKVVAPTKSYGLIGRDGIVRVLPYEVVALDTSAK